MKNSLISGKGSPTTQEGSNGDFYIEVSDDNRVLWGPKENGSWGKSFSFKIPKPKDGKDGVTVVEAGQNVEVTGDGTPEYPYEVSTKRHNSVINGKLSEDLRTLTLFKALGGKIDLDLSDIIAILQKNSDRLGSLESKRQTFYLNETIVPLAAPIGKIGGGIKGIATSNYIVVPRNAVISDITWKYLSDSPNPTRHWVDSDPYYPAPYKCKVTMDLWVHGEKIASGLEPSKAYKFEKEHRVTPGTILAFDVNIESGDPHGLSVSVGLEDYGSTEFEIV